MGMLARKGYGGGPPRYVVREALDRGRCRRGRERAPRFDDLDEDVLPALSRVGVWPGAGPQVGSGSFGPCRGPVPPSELAGVRLVPLAGVRLGLQPLEQVRVVRLEGRPLRADPRDLDEVVPRRRGRRRPLQRVAVAPGVVAQRQLPVLPRLHHVVEERDGRGAEDERADRRDRVQRRERVGRQVVDVAARHALVAQPVLDQERGVEADEGHPEVQLAELLVHHPAAHLREPEVDAGVGGEHDGAEDDVVEVRDDEVACRSRASPAAGWPAGRRSGRRRGR